VMQMLAAPKRIIRGADGKAAGVEVVQWHSNTQMLQDTLKMRG
jgi:hypothetical protein